MRDYLFNHLSIHSSLFSRRRRLQRIDYIKHIICTLIGLLKQQFRVRQWSISCLETRVACRPVVDVLLYTAPTSS